MLKLIKHKVDLTALYKDKCNSHFNNFQVCQLSKYSRFFLFYQSHQFACDIPIERFVYAISNFKFEIKIKEIKKLTYHSDQRREELCWPCSSCSPFLAFPSPTDHFCFPQSLSETAI